MSFVSERPTGHYPLSIATSLAIEGAMGIHPDNPVGKYMLKDFVNFRLGVPLILAAQLILWRVLQ
jgi:hypothetical protein